MPPKYTIYNKKYSITDNPGGNFEGHWATVLKINNYSLSRFQYRKNPMKAWLSMVFDTEKVWVWDTSSDWSEITNQKNPEELIEKIRLAFKYKMFYVTSYTEGRNNGITKETSTYSSKLSKPVDFNTNIKYKGNYWEHNIRYDETQIEIGDNHKKFDAQYGTFLRNMNLQTLCILFIIQKQQV